MSETRVQMPAAIVGQALEQVLEVMYFCEAEYRGRSRLEAPVFMTSLTFEGPVRGSFRVTVSERFAGRMSADFLALDEKDISAVEIEATVNEFASIACGAALNAWMPSADFHYSIPAGFLKEESPGEFGHCFCAPVEGDSLDAPGIAVEVILQ